MSATINRTRSVIHSALLQHAGHPIQIPARRIEQRFDSVPLQEPREFASQLPGVAPLRAGAGKCRHAFEIVVSVNVGKKLRNAFGFVATAGPTVVRAQRQWEMSVRHLFPDTRIHSLPWLRRAAKVAQVRQRANCSARARIELRHGIKCADGKNQWIEPLEVPKLGKVKTNRRGLAPGA